MVSIKELFELSKVRENKIFFVSKIIVSFLIALSFFLDSIEVFGHWHGATCEQVYFKEIHFYNCLLFLLIAVITFFILSVVGFLYGKIESKFFYLTNRKSGFVFLIIFILLLICWLPIVLSYVPGGLFDDTMEAILLLRDGAKIDNHHPLLFSYLLKTFMDLGVSFGDINIGLVIYTVLQTLFLAGSIAYGIAWLYKVGINKLFVFSLFVFFILFYIVPMYAVSIWKDTPFSIAILFYTIIVAQIVYSKGKMLTKVSGVFKYICVCFFVTFLRNNGLFIVCFTTIAIFIAYRRAIIKVYFKQFSSIIISILLFIIIQGPIYRAFGVSSEFRESVGIMIQQICYVVKNEGNISEDEILFINNIEKIENIKKRYSPYNVDMIKYYEFNDDFLEKNKIKFFEVWLSLLLKNPTMYLQAHLLNTTGFWDLVRAEQFYSKNYVYPKSYATEYYDFIWQVDVLEEITGRSIRDFIYQENNNIVYAWFGCIIIVSLIYTLRFKRYSNILVYLPALLTLITVFIAVPIAFAMRYVFPLALVMPFSICFPFLGKKE